MAIAEFRPIGPLSTGQAVVYRLSWGDECQLGNRYAIVSGIFKYYKPLFVTTIVN
jgi:hypothetical protein